MLVRESLVDKEICGFYEWLEGLWKEDVKEVGRPLERPRRELDKLYKMYLDFQSSKDVVEARKYYYGESL